MSSFSIPKDISLGTIITQNSISNSNISNNFKKGGMMGYCPEPIHSSSGNITIDEILGGCVRIQPGVEVCLNMPSSESIISKGNIPENGYIDVIFDKKFLINSISGPLVNGFIIKPVDADKGTNSDEGMFGFSPPPSPNTDLVIATNTAVFIRFYNIGGILRARRFF